MPKKPTLENHLTGQQLRRKYLSCQHWQEKKRWQGLALIAEGGVAGQVAKDLGMSANWISETVHRYNEGGECGVKNKSKNEGSKTLTDEEVKELARKIESGRSVGGEKFLPAAAESASGFGEDIFKRVRRVLRVLEREDHHCDVGRRTGTSGAVGDSRRNRTISNSGTYTGNESRVKDCGRRSDQ